MVAKLDLQTIPEEAKPHLMLAQEVYQYGQDSL